ncbi:MAG: hypothetical protein LUD03_05565 [Firmicutes bacterium]|nr:hypothetical protein [Bacillota bacterium]
MNKKIIALILAALMCASFMTGCGSSSSSSDSDKETTSSETTSEKDNDKDDDDDKDDDKNEVSEERANAFADDIDVLSEYLDAEQWNQAAVIWKQIKKEYGDDFPDEIEAVEAVFLDYGVDPDNIGAGPAED